VGVACAPAGAAAKPDATKPDNTKAAMAALNI